MSDQNCILDEATGGIQSADQQTRLRIPRIFLAGCRTRGDQLSSEGKRYQA
jgi:hypothetical protein